DAERRRLSLSLKRVEGGGVQQRADDSEAVEGTPNLDLSEEVFPEASAAEAEAEEPELEPAAEAEPPAEEPPAEEPAAAEALAEEPVPEEPAAEVEAPAE